FPISGSRKRKPSPATVPEQTPPSTPTARAPATDAPPEPPTAGREEPKLAAEPSATEPAAAEKTKLRWWQVRRGPEILGQLQAGSVSWAKKQARKQFGDNLTVEPGQAVPSKEPKAKTTSRKKGPKAPARLSALDAAAKVLAESGQPMTCQ